MDQINLVFITVFIFVMVGLAHYFSLKMLKVTPDKKARYRKIFWYFYGIFFVIVGGINLIEKGEFHWFFGLQFIFGFVIVILNGGGKINTFYPLCPNRTRTNPLHVCISNDYKLTSSPKGM